MYVCIFMGVYVFEYIYIYIYIGKSVDMNGISLDHISNSNSVII